MSETASIPCRICGCIDGEPGLCHALHDLRIACQRFDDDLCTSCTCWLREPGAEEPGLIRDAAIADYRAKRAERAAWFRGNAVPGAKQLRWHAARMRVKARRWRCQAVATTVPSRSTPSEIPSGVVGGA